MNTITLVLVAVGLVMVVSMAGYLCYIAFNILKGMIEILDAGK